VTHSTGDVADIDEAELTHVDGSEGMADEWEDASVAELHVEDHAATRGHELGLHAV
jgi:hypothetical protein